MGCYLNLIQHRIIFYALCLCHLHVFCIKQDGKAFALAIVTNKAKQLATLTDLKD